MKYFNTKVSAIITVLIIVLMLQGCSSDTMGKTAEVVPKEPTDYIKVVDYLNREVIIPIPVERIACGYAFTGHAVAMMGRGSDIVAVVGGLQRDKVLTAMYPHIQELPVPFSSGAINIEELLACRPDVVFIKTDTALNEGEVAKLDKFNIPYVVIDFYSMEEQMNTIATIGKVIGAESEAAEYLQYYRRVVDETKEITNQIPVEERISLYHSVNEAVRTDTKNSLPADWIAVTGGINVSIDADLRISGDKSFATIEQIYLWDSDIIIANEAGIPEHILSNPQWASLRAVKENRVYQIPNGISRWGHPGSLETPLAILWTSKLLYPEDFQHIDMEKETGEYYKRFLGLELSNDEISDILEGKGMREPKNSR